MKCLLCRTRKGKRHCPAKNAQICAQCCGEKRVVEIHCPADCPYLAEGQSFQAMRKLGAVMDSIEEPHLRERFYFATSHLGRLLDFIEEEIVQYCKNLRSIQDADIEEAITVVADTYNTESKGIIYEHTTSNPLAQGLSKQIYQRLETLRSEVSQQGKPLQVKEIQLSLEALQTLARFHLNQSTERESYLRFMTRNHPQAAAGSDDSPLILT